MAENGNGKKYISWQTVTFAACLVLVTIVGWAWCDTRDCIRKNTVTIEQKVDKEQYYRDLDGINKKLDTIDTYIRGRR